MPAQHLMAFKGVPLDLDQGGSRVILRDYSLESTTAVMRNSYALTNLNRASLFHSCLRFYIGRHRAGL